MKALRFLRIALAALVLVAFVALFADPTRTLSARLAPLAHCQFWPAVLAGSLGVVAAILVLTLFCGRLYCSVLCPLGILQDLVVFFRRVVFRRMFPAKPASPKRALRWSVCACFVAGGFLGLHFSWLEPYAIYMRGASVTAAPLGRLVNNRVATWAAAHGKDFALTVENVMPPVAFVVFAVALVAAVAILAAGWGRLWCSAICPVGTLLGFVSRRAWLRPRFDTAKCVKCGACARHCKTGCIDVAAQRVDASRCVACLDCSAVCPKEAMRWK